jgi:hypothetical protein
LSGQISTADQDMPVILLWVGIPVFLLGGGYILVRAIH